MIKRNAIHFLPLAVGLLTIECKAWVLTPPRRLLPHVLFQSSQDEEDFVKVPRRRQRRWEDDDAELDERTDSRRFRDDDLDDVLLDEEIYDDEDDEDEEEYDLFGNELIPNPLLDSIDPDGAAERFPELARDPRFWFDMALFIAFLNFLSSVGPRDPFPDIPMF